MVQTAEPLIFDNQSFLKWEELQEDKHQFIQGEIFAMGGARREHVVVSLNIASILKQHLKGKPCQTYISDMKLRVEQVDAFFYPDIMVSCNKEDHKAEQFLSNPSLIIEVLSDSTEAFDRGKKFAAYRQIKSLKEYVLIDIKAQRIECFRRTAENDWLLHVSENQQTCDFICLDISIDLADVFEDIQTEETQTV
ncbi:MAG: Uma2 family endonuclease [Methylococcales bacterium]|nr:Uma2 family endonuclease [Methylococcales bacterium]